MEVPSNRPLVYLACPYTHADQEVRVRRFESANRVAGLLTARGLVVFSPISHSHPISLAYELPTHWEFWERIDRAYLTVCQAIYVLCIDGWRESVGVTAELKIAEELGLQVWFTNERGECWEDPIFAEDIGA